jgi:mRNA-degrading endonuclease RelE of RelBE toxin-antitoxin system
MTEKKREPKFTPKFLSETKKLKGELKRELERAVLKILKDPLRGKPLRYSFKGCRSERVGKFRVIYELLNDFVVFHAFEHRKRVYRKK